MGQMLSEICLPNFRKRYDIPQQCRGVSGTELGLRQATTRQHKNTVGVRVPSSERVGSENGKILRPARGDWGQN